MSEELRLKFSIHSFRQISQYVDMALEIEEQIKNELENGGENPKEFFERNKDNTDIQAWQQFNEMIDECTISCRSFEPSHSTNIMRIDSWRTFLKIWFHQGDPQIFETTGYDGEQKLMMMIKVFYDKDKCFLLTKHRHPTEEEKAEIAKINQN